MFCCTVEYSNPRQQWRLYQSPIDGHSLEIISQPEYIVTVPLYCKDTVLLLYPIVQQYYQSATLSILRTVSNVCCPVFSVYCVVCSIQCELLSFHCFLCTFFSFWTAQYPIFLCTINSELLNIHGLTCTMHCELLLVYCICSIILSELFNVHSLMCTGVHS